MDDKREAFNALFTFHQYRESSGKPAESFMIQRRGSRDSEDRPNNHSGRLDILELNVGQLKTLLDDSNGLDFWNEVRRLRRKLYPRK